MGVIGMHMLLAGLPRCTGDLSELASAIRAGGDLMAAALLRCCCTSLAIPFAGGCGGDRSGAGRRARCH
jgi:hypothetical protein